MAFPESCPRPPYGHQVAGHDFLVKVDDRADGRVIPRVAWLMDEPGAGKSLQVAAAAQTLFHRGEIDGVIVVALSEGRPVWADPDPAFGELAAHLWPETPAVVVEWHSKIRAWETPAAAGAARVMSWHVTNHEYVRQAGKAEQLRKLAAGPRVLLVIDESSAVANPASAQYKAARTLRRACGWCWELNGTPISQDPRNVYSQARLLDVNILGCQTKSDFMARYAVMGGFVAGGRKIKDDSDPRGFRIVGGTPTQVLRWVNLEDLQARIRPYAIRRLKVDCLDLPPKLPPVTIQVPLTPATWKIYKSMRDDAMAWLTSNRAAVASQAGVKMMRLAQIASGFVGGVEDLLGCELCDGTGFVAGIAGIHDDADPHRPCRCALAASQMRGPVTEVGREKLSWFEAWHDARLEEDPSFKVITWSRFRAEVDRLIESRRAALAGRAEVDGLVGGQRREDRMRALRLLGPRTAPAGAASLHCVEGAGSTSVNLAAASWVVHLSHGTSLFLRTQSDDRPHRAGATRPVNYLDVVATGPQGQRTVDHVLVKALRAREDLANWTSAAWIRAIEEEGA